MKAILMSKETVRAHVVVPRDLWDDVDRLVGSRKRSAFIADAVREKVSREKRGKALLEAAGMLSAANYPEWSTPEKAAAWVRTSRAADEKRTERKLRGSNGL
jgi:metal-responsive CopG/Arc/MetJ family transcriptional regulator